jgi:hypothetical protein
MIQIKVTHHRLSELAKDAPALRRQHLFDLQKAANDQGESVCSGIILEILIREREQERKKWWCINDTAQPQYGGNPLLLRM